MSVFSGPADQAVAVTPHASTNFATLGGTACRGLFVGVGGDITAIVGGAVVLFKNVPSGTILPVRCTRVNAIATTATDMVALY